MNWMVKLGCGLLGVVCSGLAVIFVLTGLFEWAAVAGLAAVVLGAVVLVPAAGGYVTTDPEYRRRF